MQCFCLSKTCKTTEANKALRPELIKDISDMIDAVALYGEESEVKKRLLEMFDYGATEVMVSLIPAGLDKKPSYERMMHVVAEVSRSVENQELHRASLLL
jgi:hypothetical protein